MRRSDVCLYLGPADRAELQALLTNRNTARKLAWRAGIVLATAEGEGTVEIMRRTGMSKPTVWRWQERYLDEGVPGLKRETETRARHGSSAVSKAAFPRAAAAEGRPTEGDREDCAGCATQCHALEPRDDG
jgi:hypothetical protein